MIILTPLLSVEEFCSVSCRKEVYGVEIGQTYIREKTFLARKVIKPEIVVYYS